MGCLLRLNLCKFTDLSQFKYLKPLVMDSMALRAKNSLHMIYGLFNFLGQVPKNSKSPQ